jgi:eukaryotic-like serine/threonine-protein kinase
MQTSGSYRDQLLGHKLTDDWVPFERLDRHPAQTGASFSTGYLAKNASGSQAFLKAIDLVDALSEPDGNVLLSIKALTDAFHFERELCYRCRDRRLDRVVHPIAYGETRVDPKVAFSNVFYIVFEKAEGDIRSQMKTLEKLDLAWAMRSLHQIAIGLSQLHSAGIAHQDLKPSNVLVFPSNVSKIADLGRASLRNTDSPYDNDGIAGDRRYAPPELLYGHLPNDWPERRFGCDFYLLGGMATFLFTHCTINGLLYSRLSEEYKPSELGGPYAESFAKALPYVLDAFEKSLVEVERSFPHALNLDLRSELLATIRDLCHPDPAQRGRETNPSTGGVPRFDLRRFVTKFDVLARKLELQFATLK